MAGAKYKKYFEQMFDLHRDDFMEFMLVNNDYSSDKPRFKPLLDEKGLKIQKIVQEWEDKLCKQMEKGENGAYSAKLGEKFQQEVLKYFPHYHDVGVEIRFIGQ